MGGRDHGEMVIVGARETALSKYPRIHTVVEWFGFHLVYLVLPVIVGVIPVWLCFGKSLMYRAMGLAMIVSWFMSFGAEKKLGKPWPWFSELFVWKYLFAWFPITIEKKKSNELNPEQTYIFGIHPHGALAFNRAAYGFDEEHLWQRAFPKIDYRVLTATAAFFVPVIREMWLWTRCVSADKATARRVLEAKKSLVIFPGGEKEQMLSQRGKHILYLKNRKGFVKLALESKSSLIPMYAFGETDLFDHHSFLIDFRRWLVSAFGIALPFISGSFFLLPYKTPIRIVVGDPIEPPSSNQKIDDALITQYHDRYIAALLQLFNEHKARCGYPDAELVIT